MNPYVVLILGGYGHFGERIARALSVDSGIRLVLAGRDRGRAMALAEGLSSRSREHQGIDIDVGDDGLAERLRAIGPNLVIHASGPFQGRPYDVARACLATGCDYLDLADGRDFVAGIGRLDEEARQAGRVLISGASTVPGVTSAVVIAHEPSFATLRAIRVGITPAQRTPRGTATVASVLSYCGRGFRQLHHGRWVTRYGWMNLFSRRLGTWGPRWWGACDVPDLELFPRRWPGLDTVSFHAAMELRSMQLGLWLAACLTRLGMVSDWSPYAERLRRFTARFDGLGSAVGGMFVELVGIDAAGQGRTLRWCLTARQGHGPFVPCVPAIVLARKLAGGKSLAPGARACVGEIDLDEFAAAVAGSDITWTVETVQA